MSLNENLDVTVASINGLVMLGQVTDANSSHFFAPRMRSPSFDARGGHQIQHNASQGPMSTRDAAIDTANITPHEVQHSKIH